MTASMYPILLKYASCAQSIPNYNSKISGEMFKGIFFLERLFQVIIWLLIHIYFFNLLFLSQFFISVADIFHQITFYSNISKFTGITFHAKFDNPIHIQFDRKTKIKLIPLSIQQLIYFLYKKFQLGKIRSRFIYIRPRIYPSSTKKVNHTRNSFFDLLKRM